MKLKVQGMEVSHVGCTLQIYQLEPICIHQLEESISRSKRLLIRILIPFYLAVKHEVRKLSLHVSNYSVFKAGGHGAALREEGDWK